MSSYTQILGLLNGKQHSSFIFTIFDITEFSAMINTCTCTGTCIVSQLTVHVYVWSIWPVKMTVLTYSYIIQIVNLQETYSTKNLNKDFFINILRNQSAFLLNC